MNTLLRAGSLAVVLSLSMPLVAGAALALPSFPAVGNIDTVIGGTSLDPRGLAVCANGTKLYIADGQSNRVMVTDLSTGVTTRVAGTGIAGYAGDGGPALNAKFSFPTEVVCDSSGNLYIADTNNNRVRKIDSRGIVTTFVGNGLFQTSGDGGFAVQASISAPRGLALDSLGTTLYVAEFSGNKVRKVTPDGRISTAVGTGAWGFNGDNRLAITADITNPAGIALDSQGNLFITDYNNQRIRKVDATTQMISTIAGDGYQGSTGDGGPASGARLSLPYRLRFDASGNLVFINSGSFSIRRIEAVGGVVTREGRTTTIAGTGTSGSFGDGGLATVASLEGPNGLAVGPDSTIYVGVTANTVPSVRNKVRKFTVGGTISTLAGGNGDGGLALDAVLAPSGMAYTTVSGRSLLYIADVENSRIRSVDLQTGVVNTVAGTGAQGWLDGVASQAKFFKPQAVAFDSQGNLLVADTQNNRIRKVTAGPDKVVTAGDTVVTVAGNGTYGSNGDNGPASDAQMAHPYGMTFDRSGNLYIADFANSRIRKIAAGSNGTIDSTDTITTMIGNNFTGASPDGAPIASASLFTPTDVALSPIDGMLYFVDHSSHRVIRVNENAGIIEVIAGSGRQGSSSNNTPAYNAQLNYPFRIAFDAQGNLYIADRDNHSIKKVVATNGQLIKGPAGSILVTVAGTGAQPGDSQRGDGGAATSAELYKPRGIAIDADNHLFVSQTDASRIRIITLAPSTTPPPVGTGTVAGTVTYYSNNAPVPDVTVTLTKSGSAPLSITAQTDASGSFRFTDVPVGDWSVSYQRTSADTESFPINAVDAVSALQSTVGLIPVSGAKLKACDVNSSNSLSAIDASLVLQYRVKLIPYLPASNQGVNVWGFNSDSTSFTLASSGVQNLATSAYYLGDCDGSWSAR